METGRVLSVSEDVAGTTLSADASSAATSLTVNDTSAFDEAGGQLRVLGAAGNGVFSYGTPDDAASTVPISPALGFAAVAGEEVRLEPLAIERYALVGLEDAPDAPILVRVPHALIQRMPAGIRDESEREAVAVAEEAPGRWTVVDVLARGSALAGFYETDWTNEFGIPLIGGALGDDVPFSVFGAAVTTPDLVMSYGGPVSVVIPKLGTGLVRRVGQGGDTSDGLQMTLTYPSKITCTGHASVANQSDSVQYNVRFFLLAIDTDTGDHYRGGAAYQYCAAADDTNTRYRQVHNERQVFFDASPDAPRHLTWWWAFQQDSGDFTHAANVRALKMTLRISYAPDIATTSQPDRAPVWTDEVDMRAAYAQLEGDDAV